MLVQCGVDMIAGLERIRSGSFTPERSNCMGTRILALVPVPFPLSSTTTRIYFGLVLGFEPDGGSGSFSMAEIRRSASSAVICRWITF